MSDKLRVLVVRECSKCPIRQKHEEHGPCDSSYWVECGITGKEISNPDNWEISKWSKTSKFPPSCPLSIKH